MIRIRCFGPRELNQKVFFRRTVMSTGQGESNCLITSGARQGNATVECSIAMAIQFTANEHLNDPGPHSEVCLQLHCVERYSEL